MEKKLKAKLKMEEHYSFYETEDGRKMLSIWKQSEDGTIENIRIFQNISDDIWQEIKSPK
ncbi:hypothetical protein A2U11_10110 [Fusobacterium necrophorum subsp. funduliforme]|uniref:hypothetical protein n=1 Tax=Fusobacterium necrophorum TaxID=859 RepID=UPI000787B526|nr:hypothetical protein [Fusobacterium necrophorum]KYM49767.1 hypothetical protein A2U11_10110 [Fusobacterium necrophorum subsp. funduliforme]